MYSRRSTNAFLACIAATLKFAHAALIRVATTPLHPKTVAALEPLSPLPLALQLCYVLEFLQSQNEMGKGDLTRSILYPVELPDN